MVTDHDTVKLRDGDLPVSSPPYAHPVSDPGHTPVLQEPRVGSGLPASQGALGPISMVSGTRPCSAPAGLSGEETAPPACSMPCVPGALQEHVLSFYTPPLQVLHAH